jgi:hypothetical protein
MPHALELPAPEHAAPRRMLPRLAPRLSASLSPLAHIINQRLLESYLETRKMEQKVAEMKPSKRYAHTPHTLPSADQASHDVKQMGISPRKSCGEKTTLDVRLLIHWLDHGLRIWVAHSSRFNTDSCSSDINSVIMDYLVSEGYPGAAEKFALETNLSQGETFDFRSIRERVAIRNAILSGHVEMAIQLLNNDETLVSSILPSTPHFT